MWFIVALVKEQYNGLKKLQDNWQDNRNVYIIYSEDVKPIITVGRSGLIFSALDTGFELWFQKSLDCKVCHTF